MDPQAYWEKNVALWQKWNETYLSNAQAIAEKNMEQVQSLQGQIQGMITQAVENQHAMVQTSMKLVEDQVSEWATAVNDLFNVPEVNGK